MNTSPTKTTFEFTEEMKGYLSQNGQAFAEGYDKGKEENNFFMFHLTIHTEDLDTFLAADSHECGASGYVEGNLIGGRCQVEKGVFNLFIDTADSNKRQMRYRLFFTTSAGKKLTLSGNKQIQDNPGFDIWADTTTLFTNLFPGHIDAAKEAKTKTFATGILHIEAADFAVQLTTFKTNADGLKAKALAFEQFGAFFLGSLWDVYKPKFSSNMGGFEREIPLYTTEGVKGADITTHNFNTDDKLGLSLLRFNRAACDDIVVIIHGLTTSSDMFIMPEHYNLVQYLLDNKYTDVWTLDFRMSNRFSYNLQRNNFNLDDIALYDYPAAIAKIREVAGPNKRIHVICHCLGSVSFVMALFAKTVTGITSVIANSVALTPRIPAWSKIKLGIGPFLCDYVFSIEYLNPYWRRQRGFSIGKVLGWVVSQFHRECDVPECHMLSFMWGTGFPALYSHENLLDVTHRRGGDLYGGVSVNYYRHVYKMVAAKNTAVKYDKNDPRYRSLPDDYFQYAKEIETPVLFITGEDNHVFTDSNIECHRRLEAIVPGRHQLRVFPNYGHQDVFMGKNVSEDIFPTFLEYFQQHKK